MLRIDKRRHAASLLRFRNNLQRDGGLAEGFGPENLNHAAARNSADTERGIERNRPGGDDEMGTMASLLPRRMMDPLPNCFSICESARSIARVRSLSSTISNLRG